MSDSTTNRSRFTRAAVEALAVLVGVLGAFGIDALWDESQDKARQAEYVSALSDELSTNAAVVATALERLAGELDRADAFLARAAQSPALPSDSIRSYLGNFGPVFPVAFETASLSDLLGSGGLSFIEDPGLRRAIARYDSSLQELREWERARQEFWSNRMYPFHLEHFDLVGVGSPAESTPKPMDAEPFLSRTYANLMWTRRWHTAGVVRAAESLAADVAELRTSIGVGGRGGDT